MNRPKFRVWDKEVQKFADWPVYFNLTNSEIVTGLWYGYEIQVEEPLQDSNYIVQQSTGLFDKNGKEIYEGDVIHLTSNDGIDYKALIIFREGGFCAVDGVEDDYVTRRYQLYKSDCELEIIGNKFEHRELLEYDSE